MMRIRGVLVSAFIVASACGGCGDDDLPVETFGQTCDSESDDDGDGRIGCDDLDCRLNDGCVFEPPEPSSIQNILLTTGTASFYERVRFIWDGESAIQRGVADQTINVDTVSAVSGFVRSPNGDPISGAAITLHDAPEYGRTYSRADGEFDFVFNGGKDVIVRVEKPGFTAVYKTANPTWQHNTSIDVVLTPLSESVTKVELGKATFVVGSESSDDDGTRQTNVFIPEGTSAELVYDDQRKPTDTIHLRTTEVTVGESGRDAMAGRLPPSSLYTFAADFTVDEVVESGAHHVQFSQPVFVYVDNFLDVPDGSLLPNGFFDYQEPSWKGTTDGIAFTILAIENDRAVLDFGDENISFEQFAISDQERRALAKNYEPGDSLWRVPAMQFSTIDINYPARLRAELLLTPPGNNVSFQSTSCENRTEPGSIIDCDDQTLGEVIPLNGTPFNLVYNSRRVTGRLPTATIVVREGSFLPESFVQATVEMTVAGRKYSETFHIEDEVPFIHEFTWDRKDQFGRKIQGGVPATVRVTYYYSVLYWLQQQIATTGALTARQFQEEATARASFAQFSSDDGATVETQRGETFITRESTIWIGGWDVAEEKLGGWTLDQHHRYDPNVTALDFGSGGILTSRDEDRIVKMVAGTTGDVAGRLADDCKEKYDDFQEQTYCLLTGLPEEDNPAFGYIGLPVHVAFGLDGTIYYSTLGLSAGPANWIYAITRDGKVEHIAGDLTFEEDEPVRTRDVDDVQFSYITEIKVAFDGTLYVSDVHGIWRKTGDTMQLIVGGGSTPASEITDQTKATEVDFSQPDGVVLKFDVARDGSIVFVDANRPDGVIYKRMPNGNLYRIAGIPGETCDAPPCTETRMSRNLKLGEISNVAIRDNDAVIFSEFIPNSDGQSTLRTIGSDGSIRSSWTGVATDLQVGADGGVYVSTLDFYTEDSLVCFGPALLKIDGDEESPVLGSLRCGGDEIVTLADEAFERDLEDDLTVSHPFGFLGGFDITPSGDVVFANRYQIMRLFSQLPVRNDFGYSIPSRGGNVIYRFLPDGRHEQTIDGLTGTTLDQFKYDEAGRLIAITNRSGNSTALDRNGDGNVETIRGPYGVEWAIEYDSNGFLSTLTSPENERWRFTYSDGGLMESMLDPAGFSSSFEYDSVGRLTRDTNTSGEKTLEREILGTTQAVLFTSAEQRETTYNRSLAGPSRRSEQTGTVLSEQSSLSNGYERQISADNTEIYTRSEPHPAFGSVASFASFTGIYTPSGLGMEIEKTQSAILNVADITEGLASWFERSAVGTVEIETTWDGVTRTLETLTGEGRTSVTTLDEGGRVIESAESGKLPVAYTYDVNGRVSRVSQGEREIEFSYDANGYPMTVTAPGATLEMQNDGMGRPTAIQTGDESVSTSWNGVSGLRELTTAESQKYRMERNEVGQITQFIGPLSEYLFEYNADNLLDALTYPDGRTTNLTYDSAGRLSEIVSPSDTRRFSYDTGTSGTGQLLSAGSDSGTDVAFTYDGFLKTSETSSGETTAAVEWTYAENFRLQSQTVNNDTVEAEFDLDGALTKMGDVVIDYPNGSLSPSSVEILNLDRTLTYDAYGSPESVRSRGGTFDVEFDYSYDGLGRIAAIRETVQGTLSVKTFSYNAQGRLTEVTTDGSVSERYTYDGNGNRTSHLNVPAQQIVVNEEDELTRYGNGQFTYRSGQLRTATIGGETSTYDYGMFGELRSVVGPTQTIDYGHDGLNRRVSKSVDGVMQKGWVYQDALNPVAELDENGDVLSRFVYATKQHVPDYMVRDGVTYGLVTDHRGSVRWVVDAQTGTVVQALEYDTFGDVRSDTNPGFQPFGYSGGLYDSDTNLVRFGARDYAGFLGRWTARDPIGFAGGSANLFQYVNGDPVNLVDVNGAHPLGWLIFYVAVGGAVGGVSYESRTPEECQTFWGLTGHVLAGGLTGFIFGTAGLAFAGATATYSIGELAMFSLLLGAPLGGANGGATYALKTGFDSSRTGSVGGFIESIRNGAILGIPAFFLSVLGPGYLFTDATRTFVKAIPPVVNRTGIETTATSIATDSCSCN